ncbi:MAG: hypothetical protein Kow0069_08880 [Promethearchaeota archaeon]
MDELRLKRYRDKISYVAENLSGLPRKPETRLEKSGVYYQFITAVEAVMDLAAMCVKDTGTPVQDDYSNVESLERSGKIPPGRLLKHRVSRTLWEVPSRDRLPVKAGERS